MATQLSVAGREHVLEPSVCGVSWDEHGESDVVLLRGEESSRHRRSEGCILDSRQSVYSSMGWLPASILVSMRAAMSSLHIQLYSIS